MNIKKGIILAGGTGSRLYPLTIAANKQLLPIYDKPVIYYPLSVLMLAGVRDVLFISSAQDLPSIQNLFNDGSRLGMKFSYKVQERPAGLPEAFILGEDFIDQQPVAMILGDNFFHGHGLSEIVHEAAQNLKGAQIFTYKVEDPSRYGVVELDAEGKIQNLTEKPTAPRSNLAITGLYYFDGTVSDRAKRLSPSERGELEIIDLLRTYQMEDKLNLSELGRGYVWFDVGNPKSLLDASNYVEVIQSRQGIAIASPEEIAWRSGFISRDQLNVLIEGLPRSEYSKILTKVIV
ncbi:MAG: glucose-1-phosphate thymidylyltransferase RfbA [Alphaproteobacteria bacterium]